MVSDGECSHSFSDACGHEGDFLWAEGDTASVVDEGFEFIEGFLVHYETFEPCRVLLLIRLELEGALFCFWIVIIPVPLADGLYLEDHYVSRAGIKNNFPPH